MKNNFTLLFFFVLASFSNCISQSNTDINKSYKKFIGYKNTNPVFWNEATNDILIYQIDNKQITILKALSENYIPLDIQEDFEVYLIKGNKKTLIIKKGNKEVIIDVSIYNGYAFCNENNTLYVSHYEKDRELNASQIFAIDINNKNPLNTGLKGRVDKIIGHYLVFYKETDPTIADTSYDLFYSDVNNIYENILFKKLNLAINYQVSPEFKYFFGFGTMSPAVIINIDNMKKNKIEIKLNSDNPPFFTFNNESLVFYDPQSLSFRIVKIEF
ncbi:MAG: hypothetical protein WCX31_05450 [Salinivirgaceae bacterium]